MTDGRCPSGRATHERSRVSPSPPSVSVPNAVCTWADVGVRSVVGVCGIRRDGDHWRFFDDAGDYPGKFIDAEAARSGCWVTEDAAFRINAERLITMDDVRACMRTAAQGMGAFGQDRETGLEADRPASPVANGDAPKKPQ